MRFMCLALSRYMKTLCSSDQHRQDYRTFPHLMSIGNKSVTRSVIARLF
jgi:hypothetical protein